MLKIFVNTWANYNVNGADGGVWVTLPMDEDVLKEKMVDIAKAMGDYDPEYFINDYEWTTEIELGNVDEQDSITEWNDLLNDVEELDEYEQKEILAAMEAFGCSLDEAIENQQRGCFTFYPDQDLYDVAYALVNECYFTKDTPAILTRYFDYEAFARDLGYDGYTETKYGVILDN